MALIHLIYASAATAPFSKDQLLKLLEIARVRNEQRGVTGMLLYSEASFFQVLEGEEETVMALYDHIAKDTRHSTVVKIIKEEIEQRSFADWSMAFRAVKHSELRKHPGLSDVLTRGSSFCALDEGRAKKLLSAFKSGRWHVQAA